MPSRLPTIPSVHHHRRRRAVCSSFSPGRAAAVLVFFCSYPSICGAPRQHVELVRKVRQGRNQDQGAGPCFSPPVLPRPALPSRFLPSTSILRASCPPTCLCNRLTSCPSPQNAPPKTKYIEHILVATHAGEAGIGEVFRALQHRLRDSTWTVALKSLITVHFMIREGFPDVTLDFLAKHRNMLSLGHISDGWSPMNLVVRPG